MHANHNLLAQFPRDPKVNLADSVLDSCTHLLYQLNLQIMYWILAPLLVPSRTTACLKIPHLEPSPPRAAAERPGRKPLAGTVRSSLGDRVAGTTGTVNNLLLQRTSRNSSTPY